MTHAPWLEERVAGLISTLADAAPTEVDPMAMTRLAVDGRRAAGIRLGLPTADRSLVVLFLAMALAATLLGGALVAGGRLLSRDPVDILTRQALVEPFIGLPSEGLAASAPESGELVVSFNGRPESIHLDFHRMWVFADGRLIWTRNLDYESGYAVGQITADDRATALAAGRSAFGDTEPTPAVIQQRLTPEGVDLLKWTVRSAGLHQVDPVGPNGAPTSWDLPGVLWGGLVADLDGKLVQAHWTDHRLPERLADPAAWLPASVWEDQRLAGFVPARYALCLGRAGTAPDVDPATVIGDLPSDARALVRARATVLQATFEVDSRCHHEVSTEDARAIAATLEAAGLARVDPPSHMHAYVIPTDDATRPEDRLLIFFEAMLPDREVVCACG